MSLIKGKNKALVLADSGFQCLALYPIFKALEEKKIDVEVIAACGGSALMAAMVRLDYPLQKIVEMMNAVYDFDKSFSGFDKRAIFDVFPFLNISKPIHGEGIYRGDHIKKLLKDHFGKYDVKDISPHFMVQATEMKQIDGVQITEGPLDKALYATLAYFPFLPFINYENKDVVAGIFSHSLPLLPVVRNYDINMAICLTFQESRNLPENSFTEYYLNLIHRTLSIGQKDNINIALVINENLEYIFRKIKFGISMSVCRSANPHLILRKGEVAAKALLEEIEHKL